MRHGRSESFGGSWPARHGNDVEGPPRRGGVPSWLRPRRKPHGRIPARLPGSALCWAAGWLAVLALPCVSPAETAGAAEAVAEASGSEGLPVPGLDNAALARAGAMASYWSGLVRERAGDLAGARGKFEEALKEDPGNWRLAEKLAEEDVSAGRVDEAPGWMEAAAGGRPDAVAPRLALSEFYFRHRDVRPEWAGRSVAVAEEAVERAPGQARAQAHLVGVHLRAGDAAAAVAVLERAVAREEKSAGYWLGLTAPAQAVWPVSDPANRDRVLALFRKASALAPDDAEVTAALADFLVVHGGREEAAGLYRGLVQRHADDLRSREKLARVLALEGNDREAADVWQSVLRIDPQHEAAHRALAKHFGKSGDRAASVRHRAEALRWGRVETLNEALALVREMFKAGLAREALPVLERAEFNAPQSPEPPYLTALALQSLGDSRQALAAFARAEATASADESAAAQFLTEGFFYEWAAAAGAAGEIEVAEAKYREAISRVPKATPELAAKSYNGLAYLWLESGRRLEEAGPLVDRALKLDPDNAAYLDTRGWFLIKKGEFGPAAEVLLKAEEASPGPVAEISDHRAQALWALGRREEAVALLEKACGWPDATAAMKERLAAWKAEPR